MCRPYTSKVWRTDPSLISADWAEERFQGEKIIYLIKRVFTKLLTLDFSSYSIEDEEHIPDGGYFYYPETGIQELADALAAASKSNGADIHTDITIDRIERNSKTVSFKDNKTLQTEQASYSNLISTIPLNVFYDMQDHKDTAIAESIHNLVYMNIIFVFAFLNKNRISNDHWLYFPDNRILFNRAVEFSNWTPSMCPEGKTSVCFDVTCYHDSDLWRTSDEEIASTVLNDADRIEYIDKSDVESYYVYRLKYAYPFYDLDYKNKLDNVVRFFERDGCYLLGRTGMFRYNNADNSMEMGFALAENFLKNKGNASIYDYQIKHISL
jgi:protoporphyrinogen oxidase